MKLDPAEALARALAWGLLSAPEWTRADLVAAAARVVGRRYRWLGRVVDPVLAAYRSAPADRPDELARYVLASTPLVEIALDAERRGSPVRVRVIPTVPGRMGVRRWPVPEIADLAALARVLELPLEQLMWAADSRGLQRRTGPGPLHLYRYRWLSRPGTVPRLLESPTPLLRAVLRRVLTEIVSWVPVHPAAHGFVRGRSAVTHARAHVGAQTVVCADLRRFFTSITAARVNGMFRAMGYPEPVAWTLAGLCTHQTPVWVLTGMPPGGGSSTRHQLRTELRGRHLPQGAPTSPALANSACYRLDCRIAGYATAHALAYTRYADDLTLSGTEVAVPGLVATITAIAAAEGFAVNPDKTRARRSQQRQLVTGLVVNQRVGVPREYHDQLRAVLHDAVGHGPEAANRDQHPQFRSHLDGRIGWVESLNPVRGRRLRAQFAAIEWPDGQDRQPLAE